MIEPKEQVNTSTMDAVAPLMSGMHSNHPRHYKQIKDYRRHKLVTDKAHKFSPISNKTKYN